MSDVWFSARLRRVCLVEKKKATIAMDTIYIFTADGFESAFQRALAIGRATEEEYVNADGERVRWKLKEILSLDLLRSAKLDATEAYSELLDLPLDEQVDFDAVLNPEASVPVQTT